MHLEVWYDPRGTVVQCGGAVEPHDAPVLSGQLRKAFVDDPACVVCDLCRVTRLSPVCSSVFRTVAAERSWPGPPLVLVAGSEPVWIILQSTGTTRFVAVCDTVEAALAGAAQRPPRPLEVLRGSADLVAARRARAFVDEVCRHWRLESLADTAALVVSELVTNVVRHVGGYFELRLERWGRLLRIAVRDWGSGLTRWPDAPSQPVTESGSGLLVVAALTEFHGTAAHPGGGNVVWAALRAESQEGEAEPGEAPPRLGADGGGPASAVIPALTETERQIIALLPSPLSFAQIGERLGVSAVTVRATAIALYRRLGVVARADAVERALVLGLAERT